LAELLIHISALHFTNNIIRSSYDVLKPQLLKIIAVGPLQHVPGEVVEELPVGCDQGLLLVVGGPINIFLRNANQKYSPSKLLSFVN
jgi:hypothetical protein